MGKNKLFRFAENETFRHVIQPPFRDVLDDRFALKGKWNTFFGNNHPITLELGCGKGEYTTGQAMMFPGRNFIGVDIKGARIWRGARIIQENHISNAAFVRTRIDQIDKIFSSADQVNEIWITFPDPQPRESKENKRLTSPAFWNRYRKFAMPGTRINLKTDSALLYQYTLEQVQEHGLKIHTATEDSDKDLPGDPLMAIRTFYESQWREQGLKIHYLCFDLFPGS